MAKTDTCHACVYAWLEPCQLLTGFALGFPSRPQCANQPGHYGRATPAPVGKVCPNYRPRPPEPTGENVQRIILTNGMVAYVDAADYEELNRYTWQLASGGYAARSEKRRLIFMHRQIMNPPEGMFVDHIRGNRLDNTRAHLRICTRSENARNQTKHADTTSRYIGVSYWRNRKKWAAVIRLKGRKKFLGYFDDELDAARAYDYAAVVYLDDFARLNFPEEWPPERRAEVRARRDAGLLRTEDAKEKVKGKSKKAKSKSGEPRAETRGRRVAKRTTENPPQKTRKAPRRKRG